MARAGRRQRCRRRTSTATACASTSALRRSVERRGVIGTRVVAFALRSGAGDVAVEVEDFAGAERAAERRSCWCFDDDGQSARGGRSRRAASDDRSCAIRLRSRPASPIPAGRSRPFERAATTPAASRRRAPRSVRDRRERLLGLAPASGPPACARSGRPPPPVPPSASDPSRARSTALIAIGQVVGHADHQPGLAVAHADDGDDARADLLLALIDEAAEILRRDAFDRARQHVDRADLLHRRLASRRRRPWRASSSPRRARAPACRRSSISASTAPPPRRAAPSACRRSRARACPARRDAGARPRRSAPRRGARRPRPRPRRQA